MEKAIIHENGFVCYVMSFTASGSKTSNIVRNSPLEVKDKSQHCLFTLWENKSISSKWYQDIQKCEVILSVHMLLFLPIFSHPWKKHLMSGGSSAQQWPCSWASCPPSCSQGTTCTWEGAAHKAPRTSKANVSATAQVPVTPEASSSHRNIMPGIIDLCLIPCDKSHLWFQSAVGATSVCWGGNGCSTLWFRCWRIPVFSPDALSSVLGRRQRR